MSEPLQVTITANEDGSLVSDNGEVAIQTIGLSHEIIVNVAYGTEVELTFAPGAGLGAVKFGNWSSTPVNPQFSSAPKPNGFTITDTNGSLALQRFNFEGKHRFDPTIYNEGNGG